MFLGLFLFFLFTAVFIYISVSMISEDKTASIISVAVFITAVFIFVNALFNWGAEYEGCLTGYNFDKYYEACVEENKKDIAEGENFLLKILSWLGYIFAILFAFSFINDNYFDNDT